MASPKLPKHLSALKGHDLRRATVKFKLQYAALMNTPEGNLRALGDGAGVSQAALSTVMKYGYIDGPVAIKLEKFCGRAEFPRAWFNPELYDRATVEA